MCCGKRSAHSSAMAFQVPHRVQGLRGLDGFPCQIGGGYNVRESKVQRMRSSTDGQRIPSQDFGKP